MNRKHSFAVRCLALVLALVMIMSNANLGLTMQAQAAANTSKLFDLIAASDSSTEALNAILREHVSALPKLNDKNDDVTYQEAPAALGKEDATLRVGVLEAKPVNGWVPYTYTVGVVETEFDASYVANVGEDVTDATLVYKLDLNKDAEVEEVMNYISWLAGEANAQDNALKAVSGNTAMIGLQMLNKKFTDSLIEEVNKLTVNEEEVKAAVADQLTGVAEVDEQIMAEAMKAAQAELDAVKAEYITIMNGLLDRMVEKGSKYDIYDEEEEAYVYRNRLIIYSMLSQYKVVGLPYFYENAAAIISEMAALGETLDAILGENDVNADIINELIANMGYEGIDASALREMQIRMSNGAVTLAKYTSYKEIDGTYAKLGELCADLVAYGAADAFDTDLCLYSKEFLVKDDSYKYVDVTLVVDAENEKVVATRFNTDAVLTEADVEAVLAKIAFDARHYDFDASAIEALVGTVMTADVELTIPAQFKVYTLNVVDAEGNVVETFEVPANAKNITLTAKDGHEVTYLVNGEEVKVIGTQDIAVDANQLADGAMTVVLVSDYDFDMAEMESVWDEIRKVLGENAVVTTANEAEEYESLTMNLKSLDDIMVVAQTLVLKGMYPVYLNNSETAFINENAKINLQVLVDAMLNDSSFTSAKVVKMGQGKENNLLTTTMQVRNADMAFALNLTQMPSEMVTASNALSAVDEFFWFEANNGQLDVFVDVPEKLYEAFVTAAIASGYMDDDAVSLKNNIALMYTQKCFDLIKASDVTTETFDNTLKALHIDKDLSKYYGYYNMIMKLVKYDQMYVNLDAEPANVVVSATAQDLLPLLGLNATAMEAAEALISAQPITVYTEVKLTNDAPQFDALVIEPGKANDAGISNKLNTIDYTTNLVAKAPTIGKISAVTLLADINGNLNFNGNVILDLNGKTVNGSINVNGKVIIVDSNLATYNGGAVTGSVSANGGVIIGGTFGSDVSKFLRDGYFQDNGAVRNALYYIEGNGSNYTYVLNADFYQLYDGYLPSVEALAVDIATDVALNTYPRVGLAYNGKTMYALNLEDLLNSYTGNGVGGAFDAMMTDLTTFVNVEGINALANDIIDDLTNFQAMAEALNNNDLIGRRYNFTSYPMGVEIEHNEQSNTMDISFVANYNHPKNYSVALKIEGNNDYYAYAKKLLTAMSEVVFVDAEVHLQQPTWTAGSNTLSVGAGASLDVVIDLTQNIDYVRAMSIILAYGNPDRAEELMAARSCSVALSKVIGDMTVEEVFTALKMMSRDVSMADMAAKVGYTYSSVEEIAEMEAVYHTILCGMGKTLELLDVTGCDTKMSVLSDGKADFTIDAYNKVVDATVKGFTGVAELEFARFSFTIKMAEKCDKLMGDVNWDGEVNSDDAAWICDYDAELVDGSALHLCVGDVNADGEVNSDDAAWICDYDAELVEYTDFPVFNS